MSNAEILAYIENDNNLYPIFKVIATLKREFENNPYEFSTRNGLISTLEKIFSDFDITNDVDESIKDVNYEKIRIIGFQYGESGSSEFALLVLCNYLLKLSEELFERYGLIITGCTFGCDSSCILLIGISKNSNGDSFDLISNNTYYLKEFVKQTIKPNHLIFA